MVSGAVLMVGFAWCLHQLQTPPLVHADRVTLLD